MEDPEKSASQPPKTTYASMRRQRLIGLGSEASVVGFLWVGYILGGAGIGYFLDAHFHTSFLTPALLLFGAVEGFREMMVTVSRLNKNPKLGDTNRSNGMAAVERQPTAYPVTATDEAPEPGQPATRQRIFSVPAPPQPSFAPGAKLDVKASAANLTENTTDRSHESEPQPAAPVSSSEDLIKQLLNEPHDSSQ